ncbi:MAG TPA: serine/threonine-protein kinase [Thermoanaerobaculia bacterium]|jgi:tetratricopeptide (TPR) repeat protein|nr:serine/threonine-protein kinase [Thermoanaerobaculia bacterium]
MDDLVGQQIGPLRIVAPLGKGGMGVVYEARHEKLGRRVAVKVLREHERFQAAARARLLREAQILSQLSHPNICLIHDYLQEGGRDVIVLELVAGKTLRQAFADRSLPGGEEKLELAEQLLSAVAAAHGLGIVHRDLKPENVVLTAEGQAKILDFGIAHRQEEQPVTELQRPPMMSGGAEGPAAATGGAVATGSALPFPIGGVTGTVDYMSPEQALGDEPTAASDIYSLGILLQELFTGQSARRGGPLTQRLAQAARGETKPISGIDPDLAALLNRMQSLSPGARPSAVDALERLRWIRAKPRRRLRRLIATAAVAALALLAAGMAWQAWRARQAADQAEQAWAEAEGLTAFMLEDLIDRLKPLGRLDLLDQVADEAQRYYQKVPTELRSAERSYRHGLALRTLGEVLELEGRAEHAEESYRKVLAIAQALLADNPDDPRLIENLRQSWDDLGDVLADRDKVVEAAHAFGESLKLAQQLVAARPQDSSALAVLADAWDDLGGLHQQRGDFDAAMKAYEEGLAVCRQLSGRGSENPVWQSKLARAFHRIGTVHEARGQVALARAAYDETLRIDREAAAERAGDTEHLMNLAQALYDMSRVHRAEGNVEAAHPPLDEALSIDRRLVEQDPTNARWRASLGHGLIDLGDLHAKEGDKAEATQAWNEARTVLAPLSGTPYRNLYERAVGRVSSGTAAASTSR